MSHAHAEAQSNIESDTKAESNAETQSESDAKAQSNTKADGYRCYLYTTAQPQMSYADTGERATSSKSTAKS